MRKRIVALCCVLSLCMTGMGSAFAASDKPKNIAKNSSMDEDVQDWSTTGNATIEWCDDSATGKGGSAKVTVAGNYSAITQVNDFLVGETYDISFYIRMEEGSNTVTLIQQFNSGGWSYPALYLPVTSKWQKHTVKYTVPAKNTAGADVTGDGRLEFRIGNGLEKAVHYLDQVEIYPHGDVPVPEPEVWVDPLPAERAVGAFSFSDMPGHWAEKNIEALSANGLVAGMGDGTFRPEQQVTRAEFLTMVLNAMKLEKGAYRGSFKDVTAEDWFADAAQTAEEIGLIDPVMTVGGSLRPNTPITREEAAMIAAKAAELNNVEKAVDMPAFTDREAISAWAVYGVEKASAYGLLAGNPDGTFRPKDNLSRAEASMILSRVVELQSRLAIFVDPDNGNDDMDGTAQKPLRSIAAAQKLIRQTTPSMNNHIFVFLKAGEHYLDSPIAMTPQDSGNNGYRIVYTSYGDGQASITAGKHISGFEPYDEKLNIYRTYVGMGVDSRQLFVNGIRAVRARSKGGLSDCTTDGGAVGHTTTDTFLADYQHISDLEMVYYQNWTNPRCGVASISVEDGVATLVMDQPGWSHAANKGATSATIPVYYENAMELLDEPGEWYLNTHDGFLYYIPRSFEDMDTADVVLPVGEKLLTMIGTADDTIHNITFRNVEFAYTTWMRPSTSSGHSDAQNNHIRESLNSAQDVMPDTAVLVRNGRYVHFEDCTFTKLGITALQLFGAIQNCTVTGNEFYDISGSALSLGECHLADSNVVNPKERKYYITDNKITNNYIHNIGVDYKSAAAISAGFPKNTEISHNEIFDMPYSGMHLGYGWATLPTSATENFHVTDNYIHLVMNDAIFDGGGIYIMGATAATMDHPNLVCNNYIENVKNYFGSLYPDEGTMYWKFSENVIDLSDTPYWYGKGDDKGLPRWLHVHMPTIKYNQFVNNYSTTAEVLFNGTNSIFEEPHVYPDADWPEEAQAIVDAAGIQDAYLERFPDELQEVQIAESSKRMKTGDFWKIALTGKMRKGKAADMSKETVYYSSANPSVAQVSEDGVVTAVASGSAVIYTDVLLDDILKRFEVSVFVDDTIDQVEFTVNSVRLLEGYTYPAAVKATSKFGKDLTLDSAEFSMEDTSIATVSEDGEILGVKRGKTTLHAACVFEGEAVEADLPVEVISYGSEEAAELPGYNFSNELADLDGWRIDSVGQKERFGSGVRLATPGGGTNGAALYQNKKFKDELLTFDMQINADGGWPSLTFRAASYEDAYSDTDCYMIGFKNDFLELQRFNGGVRTSIFGDGSTGTPLAGPGFPNTPDKVFEYGKKYTVQVGAINEEDGVRIVLNIDGVNVLDYLDTGKGALREPGYFGLYARAGNIELTAPTLQKK